VEGWGEAAGPLVESRREAGRVGSGRGGCRSRESLLPAAFALMPVPQSRPLLRFPPPLIEPDVRISRIRLSDGLHERACAGLRFRRVWWISTTPIFPCTSAYPKQLVPLTRSLCRRQRNRRTRSFTCQPMASSAWPVKPKLKYLAHPDRSRLSRVHSSGQGVGGFLSLGTPPSSVGAGDGGRLALHGAQLYDRQACRQAL